MNKIFLSIISLFYITQVIAAPYLTTRQENIIKAIVITSYEEAKKGDYSMIFDDKQKLTPNLIDIATSQIIYLGKTGVDNVNWYGLNKEKAILTGEYRWILFASVVTSYSSPQWVCQQCDDVCIGFAREDNFPERKNLSREKGQQIEDLATKQLKEMGIVFKYSN